MREKLIELLSTADDYEDRVCRSYRRYSCKTCPYKGMDCTYRAKADHLIANGVTVTDNNVGGKWIPVTERLPENDYGKHWKERTHYLVRLYNGLMMVATFGFKEYAWWIDSHSCVLAKEHYTEVTHWMPLPEPPKGE